MRLVVVGGVTGGMGCAARYRRLDEDAEIIVLDRGNYVSFANCALPYHVGGQVPRAGQLVVQTPDMLKGALNLDVRLHHNVVGLDAQAQTLTVETPEGTETIEYDELVLSPGADVFIPPIDGIDSPRVSTLRTVDDAVSMATAVEEGARRAVVIGAGFIGLEAAEGLLLRDLDVTIVELSEHIMPPVEPEIAHIIREELSQVPTCHIREKTSVVSIEHGEDSDTVVLSDGTRLEADIILLSAGVRPATGPFEAAGVECERGAIVVDEHGRTSLPHVWAAGDAVLSPDPITGGRRVVALAGPAARAGRYIADAIFDIDTARPIPPAIGTAIVSVGTQGAGMTGANRRALDAAGIDYHTIHLHPYQHVSWFPGAEEMHLVVFFAKDDGRLLGAQGVGRDGVDKRIDLFAQAIRDGKTISDMIDLDLTYSPQFGMPKDPVIMAGLIGDNVMSGRLKLWYAEETPELLEDASALILDVRRPDEFVQGHIKGALNISHDEIRGHIDEIREAAAGRPIRTVCHSGLRSYIACRALSAKGLECSSLDGGMVTLTHVLADRLSTVLEAGEQ